MVGLAVHARLESYVIYRVFGVVFFKQKTAYEMRMSDWSSDVCSSDLGDQRALEEAVRIALQVEAVLEGAGLALVGVDRHQARPLEAAHDLPLLDRKSVV